VYEYVSGINPRAITALVVGVAVAVVGQFVAALHWLYSGAWFVGFFLAAAVYFLLMQGAAIRRTVPEETVA
jgi:nucleobase:cation symporter-1, NCS1 family